LKTPKYPRKATPRSGSSKRTKKKTNAKSKLVQLFLLNPNKINTSTSFFFLSFFEFVVCFVGGEAKVPPSEVSVPETHPRNLAELEEKICEAATEAVNAYNKAIYDLRVYNQEVNSIIDQAIEKVPPPQWETLKAKTKEKNESIKLAEKKAGEAAQNVTKLKALLSKPNFEASAATKEMVNINVEKVQEDIEAARSQYEVEKRMGNVTDKYWEKVQKARQHFCEELESLFPAIDIYNKKMEVNETDLDLFILHAYSLVLYYQKELAKAETVAHEKLQVALETARKSGSGEPLNLAQICEALEEERRKLTLCFQKQVSTCLYFMFVVR
jgi:mitofilin